MNIKNKVRSAKCGVLGALVAVGLSAFAADPSVTVGEVTAGEPWSTITVNYTLGGVDAATDYKVAFDITAGGQTASVTNDATKLTDGAATKEIDTAKLFGKQVVDTKAQVKVSLIAIKPAKPVAPEGFVDLGVKDADGKPLFWAEKNLGASKPEEYGKYYSWGDVTGQTPSGSTFSKSFSWSNAPFNGGQSSYSATEFNKVKDTVCPNGILAPAYDAATVANSSWRTPTSEEFKAIVANCVWIWCDGNNEKYNNTTVKGYIVYKAKNDADKGKANMNGTWKKWNGSSYSNDSATTESYSISDIHIFFPAAGYGSDSSLNNANNRGSYWSSSLAPNSPNSAFYLYCNGSNVFPEFSTYRNSGVSVRPVTN